MDFVNNVAIIPILSLAAAFLIFIFSFMQLPLSRRFCTGLSVFSSGIGFIISLGILFYCINNPGTLIDANHLFFSVGSVKFHWGFYIDNLSALMLVLISSISMLVQLYSYGYMRNDEGYSRYFAYLNLFNFAMFALVLSTNLIQAYVFWEAVGIMSYLLIGFWFKKESASNAAKKAFWVNRAGDTILFIGIVVLLGFALTNHSAVSMPLLGFSDINSHGFYAYVALGALPFSLLSLALIAGPLAKSAQIPFQIWLPAAMEGPTPVSALIHSATMVGAGVFLIARLYPLLILSPLALKIITAIGLLTALLCALMALVQNDIKKLLAYSTCSQLGFMFLAMGASSYSGAIFHLTTHAYFKALLFLCVGAVTYSTFSVQDVRFLGGLRKRMPVVAYGYLVGCFALSGILLSGFYSKEMIFSTLLAQKQYFLFVFALIAALLSVVYIFRSYFLIFEGRYKGSVEPVKPHIAMLVPIVLLALPSAFLGMMLNDNFQSFIYLMRQRLSSPYNPQLDMFIFIISVAALWFAYKIYIKKDVKLPDFAPLYKILKNKFYFERVYAFFYDYIFTNFCKLIKFFDSFIIDASLRLCAGAVNFFAKILAKTQNGNVSSYVFYSLGFITFFVAAIVVLYFNYLNGGG